MQIKNATKSLMIKAKKFFSGIRHVDLKTAPGDIWGFIKTHKKRSLFIGILVLAGIAGGAYLLSRNQNKVAYIQYKVSRGDITETLDVVGSVQAVPSAVLTWKTDGIVADFSVKIGDQVKTGDILMHLTDSSLDPSILQAN
ncbi:efflux RND transporter periplasmic adaptor subunit, partial [bacterium]|nr:efflux RND transporter periplasmic adaptor subunit [bacterium]